ncbi:MAG TPA: 2-amino-4-hydroxy-6-hydroxymethyldihydropteridine diphosphokinase [Thermoanaerobaculia bacterium]|nr:2-amino-4-hydroxy-6-hydroxymethyldihydropteridine diphosphokinase [Thermoanaerobaculia bacterium]
MGANLGDPEAQLRSALRHLAEVLGPLDVASLYRTAPVGPATAPPQPDFLNTAATGATTLTPEQLLALAKSLERDAGRTPGPRFGPRPLDVDLLLYGDAISTAPELTLPHPRLPHRRFVLVPLAEVAPGWPVPPGGKTVAELLAETEDQGRVERLQWAVPLPQILHVRSG